MVRAAENRIGLQSGRFMALACVLGAVMCAAPAFAAADAKSGGAALFSRDKPIEINADKLDVDQEKKTAIFDGNVDALQGEIRMKAARITVYYDGQALAPKAVEASATPEAPKPEGTKDEGLPGGGKIRKMDIAGPVHVSSPTETATGDKAVYDVAAARVTLIGNVILTRGNNIIRGSKLTINTETGRSTIESSSSANGASGGRVSGVFMPNQDGAEKKTPVAPVTGQ